MNKPNVFLDLDQTVISSETFSGKFSDWEKANKFNYKIMEDCYIVFERPGLQKFLKFLFSNFNVSIWTAASKDYALFIIENIIIDKKKSRHIDWIFFSYHCDISSSIKKGTKDLSILWDKYKIPGYNKSNTIIIDDYDEVYKTQPTNCVKVKPFEFFEHGSENDNFLEKLAKELRLIKKSIKIGKLQNNIANNINNNLKI